MRTFISPCPNFRAASAMSFRGLVRRREVNDDTAVPSSRTTVAVNRKMVAKSCHSWVRSDSSLTTKTTPRWMVVSDNGAYCRMGSPTT